MVSNSVFSVEKSPAADGADARNILKFHTVLHSRRFDRRFDPDGQYHGEVAATLCLQNDWRHRTVDLHLYRGLPPELPESVQHVAQVKTEINTACPIDLDLRAVAPAGCR